MADKNMQNFYSVMQWTNDRNRVSVHNNKYITEPKKPLDSYVIGDTGSAVYPGYPGRWKFVILSVGANEEEQNDWMKNYVQEAAVTNKKATKSTKKLASGTVIELAQREAANKYLKKQHKDSTPRRSSTSSRAQPPATSPQQSGSFRSPARSPHLSGSPSSSRSLAPARSPQRSGSFRSPPRSPHRSGSPPSSRSPAPARSPQRSGSFRSLPRSPHRSGTPPSSRAPARSPQPSGSFLTTARSPSRSTASSRAPAQDRAPQPSGSILLPPRSPHRSGSPRSSRVPAPARSPQRTGSFRTKARSPSQSTASSHAPAQDRAPQPSGSFLLPPRSPHRSGSPRSSRVPAPARSPQRTLPEMSRSPSLESLTCRRSVSAITPKSKRFLQMDDDFVVRKSPRLTKNLTETVSREEFEQLKEECFQLKRRVRKLESAAIKSREEPELFNGHSKEDLANFIKHERDVFKATYSLMTSLFTKEEIVEHSVSGKAPNSKTPAKPKFERKKYSLMLEILNEKFATLEQTVFTAKIQAVQKRFSRSINKPLV